MRIWFDTEFIEDGRTIDLVSIGLVREDGETYYAEAKEADLSRADDWVRANVLAHLTGEVKPRAVIAEEIKAFVGEAPEFWAYYADYDWVALCQLYGRMIDLPKGWPMFCRDIQQERARLGIEKLPEQVGVEHNALADALWNKEAWEFVTARADAAEARVKALEEALTALVADVQEYERVNNLAPSPGRLHSWFSMRQALAALASKEEGGR